MVIRGFTSGPAGTAACWQMSRFLNEMGEGKVSLPSDSALSTAAAFRNETTRHSIFAVFPTRRSISLKEVVGARLRFINPLLTTADVSAILVAACDCKLHPQRLPPARRTLYTSGTLASRCLLLTFPNRPSACSRGWAAHLGGRKDDCSNQACWNSHYSGGTAVRPRRTRAGRGGRNFCRTGGRTGAPGIDSELVQSALLNFARPLIREHIAKEATVSQNLCAAFEALRKWQMPGAAAGDYESLVTRLSGIGAQRLICDGLDDVATAEDAVLEWLTTSDKEHIARSSDVIVRNALDKRHPRHDVTAAKTTAGLVKSIIQPVASVQDIAVLALLYMTGVSEGCPNAASFGTFATVAAVGVVLDVFTMANKINAAGDCSVIGGPQLASDLEGLRIADTDVIVCKRVFDVFEQARSVDANIMKSEYDRIAAASSDSEFAKQCERVKEKCSAENLSSLKENSALFSIFWRLALARR